MDDLIDVRQRSLAPIDIDDLAPLPRERPYRTNGRKQYGRGRNDYTDVYDYIVEA